MQAHSTRDTHIKLADSVDNKKSSSIDVVCNFQKHKDNIKKERDLKLSVYIACHAAIRSVNYLPEILNQEMKGLQLHRTKCGHSIKNVIAPNVLKELIENVGDSSYSVIIDESTDVSSFKYLYVFV